MTDRHIAYTVLLKEPVREDDAEHIINAIQMIKGVRSVQPVVQDVQTAFAYERARSQLVAQLWKVLEPNIKGPSESE